MIKLLVLWFYKKISYVVYFRDYTNYRDYYISFDGKIKYSVVGSSFFDAVNEEINIIRSLPLYDSLRMAWDMVPDKKGALVEMNRWKMPQTIFSLMPKWWRVNGVQDISPSVTAIHEIIKSF